MDKKNPLDFKFSMLTIRQLIKLCSEYKVFIQGAMPNYNTPYADILEVVEKELEVLDDGTIQRKDSKSSHKEASFLSGSGIRVIII
jgi:hypothetical protein